MPSDMTGLALARQRWPKHPNGLSAPVRAVFTAWEQCQEGEQDEALDQIDGFTRPPGRFTSKQKCRDLTLLRSPLPSSSTDVPILSDEDVSIFFDTVSPGTSSTPRDAPRDRDAEESDTSSIRSSHADDRLSSMESAMAKCLDTIAKQHEQLVSQAATLERLFKAQADPDEVMTSTYEVADSILMKLGRNAAGKMSWLDIKPLPKSERRRILREHGGTFATFPPDLDMLASTKALKLVQEAKVTLPHFATQEVAKFMSRNTGTIKMCGTVLSRIREMKSDLTYVSPHLGEDDEDETSLPDVPKSIPTADLLEFLTVLESAADGAMDLAIDTQTLMRLSVSRRIETALGVAHLHQDPNKHPKEDFMSPKTLTVIEDAAKMREDLTWAMEARKTVTGERNTLFQNRLRKSPGGGQRHTPASGTGRGRGAGSKGGTGKGKGSGKRVKWDKEQTTSPDPTDE